MADEKTNNPPLPDPTIMAHWLRALAAEIERDPVLLERIAQSPELATNKIDPLTQAPMDATPVILEKADTDPIPSLNIEPESTQPVVSSDTEIAPSLIRHGRRSSRYGPPTISGLSRNLGTGTPDPLALLAKNGEDGLRSILETVRAGTLRAIIRDYELDPEHTLPNQATEKRMITFILAAAKKKSGKSTKRTSRKKSNDVS
jgi:hypothetical protein